MRVGGFNLMRSMALAAVLAGSIAPFSAAAQRGRVRIAVQQRRATAAAQRQAERQAEKSVPNGAMRPAQPNLRGMAGLPPKWVENMRDMPPADQDRFMQNDKRFKNLPPERRQQIRDNLQKWNSLTPEQQEQVRQRNAALERMTPEQRQYFVNVVGPRYQALAPDRRQAVNRHLAVLGRLSPDTQQDVLNDPKFMEGLSPDEQDLVRNLNSLRNPPPAQ